MISFKDKFIHLNKENAYFIYAKYSKKPLKYEKITRIKMYQEIIIILDKNPDIIFDFCSIEEISILKSLLDENIPNKNNGYINYLLFKNLENNLLVNCDNEYYIPEDLINYVKMAFNIYDKETTSLKDITNSILIGLTRIYNVINVNDLSLILNNYYINISISDLKKLILNSPVLKDKMFFVKYKNNEYLASLEYNYYKDIVPLLNNKITYEIYDLEEVISIGKYNINLFDENIFNFLCFLEDHLDEIYIDNLLHSIILYCGFDFNDEKALNYISCGIPELKKELINVINYFPVWIYSGNTIKTLGKNMVVPNKNSLCPCGSGKKYKNCCGKI